MQRLCEEIDDDQNWILASSVIKDKGKRIQYETTSDMLC